MDFRDLPVEVPRHQELAHKNWPSSFAQCILVSTRLLRWYPLHLRQIARVEDVAGLPSSFKDDSLPAKQFDRLVLNAQLLLLNGDAGFAGLQDRIKRTATALETLSNVPIVAKEMELILDLQADEYWTDITVDMLEDIRRRLRSLVELIKPKERKIVITDFEDEIGEGTGVDLPDVGTGIDKGRFKMKVRKFLGEHADHIALQKLKRAEQLTPQDLSELERLFIEEGVADQDTLSDMNKEQGLGVFLRSLTGLDRASAKAAFSTFTAEYNLNSNQTEFLNLIIDNLTEAGIVEPTRFYESPFTDFDDMGIAGVFSLDQAKKITQIVRALNKAAAA